MAENRENAVAAVPPNSETNTVVETTEMMENLPVSEISQGGENSTMDIVSIALSNVTETANLMTVVDSNVVTEEVQQFEQVEAVEVVEQQVVQEIPIGSDDMVITTADGQIILPSNSTPAELSAVETLVGGALQQTVLSQPVAVEQQVVEQVASESSTQETGVVSAVPVVESSTPGIVNLGGGAQGISASSLLGSIATMIDSTESSIQASGSSSSFQLAALKINTTTSAPGVGDSIVHRTIPANNVNLGVTSVDQAVVNSVQNVPVTNPNSSSGLCGTTTTTAVPVASSNVTTMGLKSVLAPPSQSSLPSTITIKTPPGSNSVSPTLLNSILNNSDVQSLLQRNPGQPITIVRIPEDSPGGKNVNKITVTTGPVSTPGTIRKPPYQQTQPAKTYMRITTPRSKSGPSSVKSQPNTPNSSASKRRPGRPPKVREPPPEPIVVKSKKTRSGRVSRPPIHRVRDYKTIHIQEMGEPDDEKDDFGDYDGDLLKNSQGESYPRRSRDFRCEKCDKAYIGKARLARHFKNNPDHGDPADLGITYDDEEDKSEQGTPAKTVQVAPIRRKRRGRPPGPRPPNGDPDFIPNKCTPVKATPAAKPTIDFKGAQGLHRRKQRIQELIKTIGDKDLMELVLPRLAKAITVWEFLLMKVEEAHSQKLPFQEILQHFESVRKHVRLSADECLEKVSAKCDKQDDADVQSEKRKAENHQTTTTSKSDDSNKSDEVPTSSDKEQKLTGDAVERETDDQQVSKDKEPSASEGSKTTEIQTKSNAKSSTSESNTKVTENGDTSSGSEQTSESKVDELTNRTDDKTSKETDRKADKEKDNQVSESVSVSQSADNESTDKTNDKTSNISVKETDRKEDTENENQVLGSSNVSQSADNANNTASKSSTKITTTDFLELDEEVAKALGMEVGRYSIRDWTSTKLPAMYRFSKKVDEEEEKSPSEEDPEDGEPSEKRPRMDEASTTMQVSSSTSQKEKEKQVTKIQLLKANSSKQPMPALSPAPGPKMQLVVHNNTNEYKPATVPMSLKAVEAVSAAGDSNVSSTTNKQQQQQQQQVVHQQQTVTSHPVAVTAVQQVEEVPQPMETEQSNEASKTEEKAEETTETAVTYQTEEQNQSSIVPEGSTIMQMEDGTFLVQKPDGTAMQIHCTDGMTIETIQALLSMDASNILQAAE